MMVEWNKLNDLLNAKTGKSAMKTAVEYIYLDRLSDFIIQDVRFIQRYADVNLSGFTEFKIYALCRELYTQVANKVSG
jgi:hypothetical protein